MWRISSRLIRILLGEGSCSRWSRTREQQRQRRKHEAREEARERQQAFREEVVRARREEALAEEARELRKQGTRRAKQALTVALGRAPSLDEAPEEDLTVPPAAWGKKTPTLPSRISGWRDSAPCP